MDQGEDCEQEEKDAISEAKLSYYDPLNEDEEDYDTPYFVKILINNKFLSHIKD